MSEMAFINLAAQTDEHGFIVILFSACNSGYTSEIAFGNLAAQTDELGVFVILLCSYYITAPGKSKAGHDFSEDVIFPRTLRYN